MPKKLLLLSLSGLTLLLFWIFSYLVRKDYLAQFDFDIMVKIQDRIPTRFNDEFAAISLLGRFEAIVVILAVALLFNRKFFSGVVVFAGLAGAHLVEIYGKNLLNHPSPPMHFLRDKALDFFPQWYSHPLYSYPSGHSMRSAFLAVIFIYLILNSKKLSKNLKVFLSIGPITLAVLIMFSKLVLGEHWPSDIIGGAILGLSFGLFSLIFLKWGDVGELNPR